MSEVALEKAVERAMKQIHERDDDFTERPVGILRGYVPVQGEGIIDGKPWYFRARGDSWSLSISENTGGSPIEVRWGNESGWYYEDNWGEWPDAGYMSYEEAWKIIEDCFVKFRAGEGYHGT